MSPDSRCTSANGMLPCTSIPRFYVLCRSNAGYMYQLSAPTYACPITTNIPGLNPEYTTRSTVHSMVLASTGTCKLQCCCASGLFSARILLWSKMFCQTKPDPTTMLNSTGLAPPTMFKLNVGDTFLSLTRSHRATHLLSATAQSRVAAQSPLNRRYSTVTHPQALQHSHPSTTSLTQPATMAWSGPGPELACCLDRLTLFVCGHHYKATTLFSSCYAQLASLQPK
jgi:hypothetical protein